MTTATTTAPVNTAPTERKKSSGRPEGGTNRSGPLSEQEIEEILNSARRIPGLGRIMLGLVRNRNARVLVPETALGSEMLTIVNELDRVAARGERQLARTLTLENLQAKNSFQERALALITPMAELTAEMAMRFDNPANPIIRHSRTKAFVKALQGQKAEKATSQPTTQVIEPEKSDNQ